MKIICLIFTHFRQDFRIKYPFGRSGTIKLQVPIRCVDNLKSLSKIVRLQWSGWCILYVEWIVGDLINNFLMNPKPFFDLWFMDSHQILVCYCILWNQDSVIDPFLEHFRKICSSTLYRPNPILHRQFENRHLNRNTLKSLNKFWNTHFSYLKRKQGKQRFSRSKMAIFALI